MRLHLVLFRRVSAANFTSETELLPETEQRPVALPVAATESVAVTSPDESHKSSISPRRAVDCCCRDSTATQKRFASRHGQILRRDVLNFLAGAVKFASTSTGRFHNPSCFWGLAHEHPKPLVPTASSEPAEIIKAELTEQWSIILRRHQEAAENRLGKKPLVRAAEKRREEKAAGEQLTPEPNYGSGHPCEVKNRVTSVVITDFSAAKRVNRTLVKWILICCSWTCTCNAVYIKWSFTYSYFCKAHAEYFCFLLPQDSTIMEDIFIYFFLIGGLDRSVWSFLL